MASVRAANGGNARCVPRSGKPIVNGRADAAALDRRLARPVMTGNEQDNPVAGVNRLLETAVDGARWVPPSNLNTEYAPSPLTANVYVPSPIDSGSTVNPRRSA